MLSHNCTKLGFKAERFFKSVEPAMEDTGTRRRRRIKSGYHPPMDSGSGGIFTGKIRIT